MANRSCRRSSPRGQAAPPSPPTPVEPLPLSTEPAMRRWPHPIAGTVPPAAQPEPMLHYIRCALAYQNELLGEIKTLLEEISAGQCQE